MNFLLFLLFDIKEFYSFIKTGSDDKIRTNLTEWKGSHLILMNLRKFDNFLSTIRISTVFRRPKYLLTHYQSNSLKSNFLNKKIGSWKYIHLLIIVFMYYLILCWRLRSTSNWKLPEAYQSCPSKDSKYFKGKNLSKLKFYWVYWAIFKMPKGNGP